MKGGLPSAPSALAVVFHGHADQVRVGNGDHRVRRRAQDRGAQVDFDDFAFRAPNHDPVADAERPVHEDGHGTKEIRNRVLGGQGQSQSADAEPCDKGGQVQAEGVGHKDTADEEDDEAQDAFHGRDHGPL